MKSALLIEYLKRDGRERGGRVKADGYVKERSKSDAKKRSNEEKIKRRRRNERKGRRTRRYHSSGSERERPSFFPSQVRYAF